MPSFTVVASALAFASIVSAQSFAQGGVGRFPCSSRDAAGVVTEDASMCTNAQMTANQACPPSAADAGIVDGGFKNNGAGADTGSCGGSGTNGNGALCDDGCAAGNQLCASALCDGNTGTCVAAGTAGASQRARSRRSDGLVTRGLRCPASHTACTVSGSVRGFECIDTDSNLEQCGACSSSGGVDCTAIAGVDAVGCVAGQCEIWACAEGFAWDALSSSCAAALVV
ncbi:hypothetical protein P7C70_g6167, partial [Phenoliferia sp. Uapishka_3]